MTDEENGLRVTQRIFNLSNIVVPRSPSVASLKLPLGGSLWGDPQFTVSLFVCGAYGFLPQKIRVCAKCGKSIIFRKGLDRFFEKFSIPQKYFF